MARKSLRALGVSIVAGLGLALGTPAASGQSIDDLGRPSPELVGSIEAVANQPFIPQDTRETIARALGFWAGGQQDPNAPVIPGDGPPIAQFMYPTIMENCIGGASGAVGTATAVPGPAELPLPGVPPHQAGFVFTALGTGAVAEHQNQPLTVTWLNTSNFRSGVTDLHFHGVNPEGPATVNGVADTGPGHVIALMQGGVTIQLEDGRTADCNILPTVGTFNVG